MDSQFQTTFPSPQWDLDHFRDFIFPESVCEGFFVKKRLHNYMSSRSSHLHIYIFTSSHLHIYIFTSSHLHIYIFTSAQLHLHMFTSAHLHLHTFTSAHLHLHIFTSTSSHLHICRSTSLLIFTSTPTSLLIFTSADPHVYRSFRSSFNSLSRPGVVPPAHHESQASAEIVRVEGAKCR